MYMGYASILRSAQLVHLNCLTWFISLWFVFGENMLVDQTRFGLLMAFKRVKLSPLRYK